MSHSDKESVLSQYKAFAQSLRDGAFFEEPLNWPAISEALHSAADTIDALIALAPSAEQHNDRCHGATSTVFHTKGCQHPDYTPNAVVPTSCPCGKADYYAALDRSASSHVAPMPACSECGDTKEPRPCGASNCPYTLSSTQRSKELDYVVCRALDNLEQAHKAVTAGTGYDPDEWVAQSLEYLVQSVKRIGVGAGVKSEVIGAMCHEIRHFMSRPPC
jgi:hypothetical protein